MKVFVAIKLFENERVNAINYFRKDSLKSKNKHQTKGLTNQVCVSLELLILPIIYS